jgi:alkylhydroperoxidase family enzyme
MKEDWRSAPLAEADRAMLAYAEKLTRTPSAMTRADLDELRRHFTEEQAYDIVVIACLFNFMDRAADAFGVELDPRLLERARSAPEGEALGEVAAAKRS